MAEGLAPIAPGRDVAPAIQAVETPTSAARAWWTVAVLLALSIFSYLDRQIIALMIDPIRRDLHVTDFQVSLLHGFAFVLFYVVFGLVFGWAADRFSRRKVIFIGLTIWSLAASACGLARSFGQLFIARFGVGAGEAALAPAGYSLISAAFPKRKLSLPMAVFGAGGSIGGALALVIGGAVIAITPKTGVVLPVLGHLAAWQVVLLATGAPCLLISWLVFTIYEPKRRVVERGGASIADAAAFMRTRVRFFVGHFIGIGLMSMCGYGMVAWLPTYLHRHFGTPMAKVGVILGISQAITGAVSALFMGLPVDLWYQRGRADAHLRFLILCGFVQVAAVVCVIAAPSLPLCIAFVCVYTLTTPFMGPAVAALQIVTPPEFRGRVSSVYLMVFNILGIGCGPSAVGFLTTYVFKSDAMVGWAMVTAHFILMPFCLGFLALALRPLREAAASGITA